MNWAELQKEEEKQEREDCKRNAKIDLILTGQRKPSDEYIVRKLAKA